MVGYGLPSSLLCANETLSPAICKLRSPKHGPKLIPIDKQPILTEIGQLACNHLDLHVNRGLLGITIGELRGDDWPFRKPNHGQQIGSLLSIACWRLTHNRKRVDSAAPAQNVRLPIAARIRIGWELHHT